MKEIGAFEAKSRLGQVLDMVERGEEVVITRHGRAVAKMVPISLSHDRDHARQVANRLLATSRGVTLGGLKIKDIISEGRR